ncbi:hypothetical protein CASFOL_009021 [Castilleja foliolosa]|uniref:Uncharacterized protein n=1 Tax=Castilleja foliolosa TaxID=1961234 RepID=A0ABD3E0N9_9LAMI
MASAKYFCFSLTLLALLAVNLFSSSGAHVAVPVIHIIRATTKPIQLQLSSSDGGDPPIVQLKHGQHYHVKVLNQNIQYVMMAYYLVNSYSFALVDLYNPARDSGHAAIYWKADSWGFSISYDHMNYTQMVEWKTE